LVNDTFADATARSPIAMSATPKDQRWLIKSSLTGTLDDALLDVYTKALGPYAHPGEGVESSGKNGRVKLVFETGSGVTTTVDLGATLILGMPLRL
jgi:hypothetical protein